MRSRACSRVFPRMRARPASLAVIISFSLGLGTVTAGGVPAAQAGGPTIPAPTMYGYAKGPLQHLGTAAGLRHYVPVSATRARSAPSSLHGHPAPRLDLAPPAVKPGSVVTTGAVAQPAGHLVAGHRTTRPASAPAAAPAPESTASPSPPESTASPSPSGTASPSPSSTSTVTTGALAATGTDNATYSVASIYDTVPMANQDGRILVTLSNTGTSTWTPSQCAFVSGPGCGYGLVALVFAASDTTGTGAPLTTGMETSLGSSVAPGASVTVEGITPAETPGSYTLCWDMINAAGRYFSDEGGNEYCAPYTVQQYQPVINEQLPLPGTDVSTQQPGLTVSAVIPGNYPANPVFTFAFKVWDSTGTGTEQDSGWVANNGDSWTPPKPLNWGDTYYWQAAVTDAATPPAISGSGITWTAAITFVVGDAQPAIAHRWGNTIQVDDGNPDMTSDLGGADYNGSGSTVDPRTGNVSLQITDASVATVGPALSVTRTYNSLDPRTTQALGAGWSSVLDMSLVPDPDGTGALILTLANGRQVRFAKTAAGGYAPPGDFYAVVAVLSGGGFAVMDQKGDTYSFAQASGTSWLLSAISDRTGMTDAFTYSSGLVSAITNTTSGRSLRFTWTTPSGATSPHVATATTDPVAAGQPGTALTWTYGYNGNLLATVCMPGMASDCIHYGYVTNGSHAATSVLNASPVAYWRLNDPASATVAANQVPVNELTTADPPATEFNTTPGVAGPVPGVTATSFNGTSSFIPLDGVWCTTPGQVSSCVFPGDTGRVLGGTGTGLAISLWFKTTTASGVLLSLAQGVPGKFGTAYFNTANLLQIASNGDLQGYAACGLFPGSPCTWMSSPTPVDDGAWHQAVLIPGNALYLDGKEVAAYNGAATALPSAAVLLGTGEVSTGAQWSYFNGSMADLSIYQNQLPGVGTIQAQYSAETHPAAELSSVTSPAGRTELSATYDTVNDRVAALTDVHGGKWTYSMPVSGSLSAAYDDAILGSSPTDFWPLSDSSGPLARDLVGGAATAANPRPPATYTNITLGNPGPTAFTDGTSATFSGSSSQISIPGGYFAGGTNNGAESVELWFSTTATSGTLLSTGAGDGKGTPPAIWIDSSGCLNGSAGSMSLAPVGGFGGGTICTKVNDGKWHQVILTVTPVTHSVSLGIATTTQGSYLYLDGSQLYTASTTTPAAVSGTGYTAYIGNGSKGDFNGSIADVSLYTSQLSAQDATGHFNAVNNAVKVVASTNMFGQPTYLATPTLNTQTIAVTDPAGKNAQYVYGGGALIRTVSVLGGTTYYGYDAAMRAAAITDPDGDTTYTTHDAHGNITSTTSCAAVNNCQTWYAAYYENPASPLDPRNDKPTDDRDPRSQSPSDPAYDTVTTYTPAGLIATTRTPPTAACPAGCLTTHTYTTGSEAAVGGGTEPAGLLASVTTPGGGTATYAYNAAGDLMTATDPLGLVTKYTYNYLGWELTKTEVSDTYPAGLTVSFTRDGLGRIVAKTNPPVTDRITGAVHTEGFTYTYDPDGLLLTSTISDSTGGDPSRTTTYTYDAHRNLSSIKDPLGNITTFTSDDFANTTSVTDPAGRTFTYSYDDLRHLLTTTLDGYTGNPSSPQPPVNLTEESRAYDPAGRLASVTDVQGTQTDYTYYGSNLLASSYIPDPGSGAGHSDVTTYSYDPEGNITQKTSPGGLVVTNAVNAANQVVSSTADPAGADLTTSTSYDPDGNVTASSVTGGGTTETTTATYNTVDQPMSSTVVDGSTNLTTTYQRDERGLVTSVTDPAGNVTHYQNDELGRPVVQTLPPVQSQNGSGGAAVTANPVFITGYDTFGDVTESADADGNITTAVFNGDGQQTSVTAPSYTPPGGTGPVNGTTTMTWDSIGQQTSVTDPRGGKTQMAYDQLGDLASQSDADGGTWTYSYDPAGEQTSVTDPTGAQTQATYDARGRMITSTQLVRQNTSAAFSTSYGYDDAGNQTSVTTPTGVTSTAAYNALGELATSTDGAGSTTSYAYNLNGQTAKVTLPDGSAATAAYDQAGRITSVSQLNAAGTVLRTASAGYDADGNMTSWTDFRGTTTTWTYDPTGELTALTHPVTATQNIQLGYGYDLNGNLTQQVSGNGNSTWTTYNSRGLPQAITEPPAGQYTSAADSTTTDSYDAAGNLVQQTLPGGTQVTGSYDPMGRLLTQSGTGATAATAARTWTYDTAGRMLTAATAAAGVQGGPGYQPATAETFGYDDRGLLLAAAGSAGTSSFTYNASGQLTTGTGPAGTSTYTYGKAGLLATDADAASGVTGTYSYNNLSQVTSISYGTGNDTRSYSYDPMHRLASDTLSTAAGTQAAAISYGYDNNNDITSMTTSGLATAGGGTGTVTNTYGYDLASRLTSWTATPAGGTAAATSYGYDNDGNLTSNGSTAYSYDARDQLTSDSKGTTYTYTASGDLTAQAAPGGTVTSYTSDAYGQQITDAGSAYTWDALNRVVGAVTGTVSIALTYSGDTGQLTSDGTATYSRDPSGALTGINNTAGGQTLALTNQHNDLAGTFTAGGATLASSATYDPWGQVIAAAGPVVQIGYQGQWTDPATGQVNMGSRFYNPAKGSFLNHDTAPAGNPYAYAGDNPVTVTDLTGHSPDGESSGTGQITQAQVDQAKARAADARAKADRAKTAAAQARNAEAQAATALSTAADYARQMDSKAAQAHQAATEAQQQADQAQQTVNADLGSYASIQSLADAVKADQKRVQNIQDLLNKLQNMPAMEGGQCTFAGLYSCTGFGAEPGSPSPAECQYEKSQVISSDQSVLQGAEEQLQSDQAQLTRTENAEAAYQRAKEKADTLWRDSQEAADAASRARHALSLAQATYQQAKTTANRLTKDAEKAEKAAQRAENEYEKLKRAYDAQQAAKKKKKHPNPKPSPCSTSCVPKPFPPLPIRPPEPRSCGYKCQPQPPTCPSGPNCGTTQTGPPGDTPTPSTSGAGQGSGSGGSGGSGQAPDCTPEGGQSLSALADQVRRAAIHPAAANQRTIAVGINSQGELFAGSSNGFDAGQRAILQELGITRVPGSAALHAEEELLRGVPNLKRIGTSVRSPCGPDEHNCLQQLNDAGVEIEC